MRFFSNIGRSFVEVGYIVSQLLERLLPFFIAALFFLLLILAY